MDGNKLKVQSSLLQKDNFPQNYHKKVERQKKLHKETKDHFAVTSNYLITAVLISHLVIYSFHRLVKLLIVSFVTF